MAEKGQRNGARNMSRKQDGPPSAGVRIRWTGGALDLSVSALVVDVQGQLLSQRHYVDAYSVKAPSRCVQWRGVLLEKKRRVGELFRVEFSKLPILAHQVIFLVGLDGLERGKSLTDLKKVEVLLVLPDGTKLKSFEIPLGGAGGAATLHPVTIERTECGWMAKSYANFSPCSLLTVAAGHGYKGEVRP